MPGQALEAFRLELVPVPHFDAIRPALGELAQKLVLQDVGLSLLRGVCCHGRL